MDQEQKRMYAFIAFVYGGIAAVIVLVIGLIMLAGIGLASIL
jgi:hypothetical protein